MQAPIELTPHEQKVLDIYRDPSQHGIYRAVRLSLMYALGAGLFTVVAIQEKEPLYACGVYVLFLAFMLIRIRNARRLVGVMPAIIRKYEEKIRQLEAKLAP